MTAPAHPTPPPGSAPDDPPPASLGARHVPPSATPDIAPPGSALPGSTPDDLAATLTGAVAAVDGVDRLYRPGGLGGTIRSLIAPLLPGAPATEVAPGVLTAPGVVVSDGDRLVVTAHLGVVASLPAQTTLRAAADALLAALPPTRTTTPDLDITLRVSRIV